MLLRMLPGDPADALAGPQAALEDVETVRVSLDLDKPMMRQYLTYMGTWPRATWAISYSTRRPVLDEIKARWPATLELSLTSMLVAIACGVPLGIHAAAEARALGGHGLDGGSPSSASRCPRSGWGCCSSSASR